MMKTASELKSELKSLVQSFVDKDDCASEDTDRAMEALRSLEGLKLTSSEKVSVDDHEKPPAEFICPLSCEIMKDPVLIASGRTYDRRAIKKWMESGRQSCPITKKRLSHFLMIPNQLVKEMILKWIKETVISRAEKQILLDLLASLSSSDIHVQKTAAKEIRQRSKSSEIFRSLFGRIPEAIHQMIEALTAIKDLDVEDNCVTALLNISVLEGNKKLIAQNSVAIPVIIKSLKSENDQTRSNSAKALFSLSALDPIKRAIGVHGAMKPLIELVDEAPAAVMKDAAEAIFSLCHLPENRRRAVADGAVSIIVEKIRKETLVGELLTVLTLLCSQGDGVKEMVEADAVSLLLSIMRADESEQLNKENALAAICSICSVDGQQLKNVDKNESKHGTVHQLAKHGTPRAQKDAKALIEKLSAWALP